MNTPSQFWHLRKIHHSSFRSSNQNQLPGQDMFWKKRNVIDIYCIKSLQLWPLVCSVKRYHCLLRLFLVQLIHQNKQKCPCHFSLHVLSYTLPDSLFCVSLWPFSHSPTLSNVFLPQSPCAFVAVIFPDCSVQILVCGINMNEPCVSPLAFTALSGEQAPWFVLFFLLYLLFVDTDSCLWHAHPVQLCLCFLCRLSSTLHSLQTKLLNALM